MPFDGTGILSVALAQFPSNPWLFALEQALWLFNIILFVTCMALYAARWVLYFHEASRVFSHSPISMFFGRIPMGLATIINGFLIHGVPRIGEVTVVITSALWWFDVVLSLACGLAIPFMMFTRQSRTLSTR